MSGRKRSLPNDTPEQQKSTDTGSVDDKKPRNDDSSAQPLFSESLVSVAEQHMDQWQQKNESSLSISDVLASVKQFWDRRPCNLRHSPEPVGTRKYFDDVEARKYKVEPHIPRFAEFDRWRGKRVLEIGCGLGTEAVNFARAGAHVTAVDLSPVSLDLARKRFEVFGLEGSFHVANAETLVQDLRNATAKSSSSSSSSSSSHRSLQQEETPQFDLIWSFGVLHHTPRPQEALAQIRQLLAPGGELRIMVYSKVSYKLFFLMRETGVWDFSRIGPLLAAYSEAQSGCPVTYAYTEDEVRNELLPPSQWHVDSVEKDHIFPYSIPEYRQFKYVKEPCWANVDDRTFQQLCKELGWHTLIKARKVE